MVVVVVGSVVVVVPLDTVRCAVWLVRAWSTPSVAPAPENDEDANRDHPVAETMTQFGPGMTGTSGVCGLV